MDARSSPTDRCGLVYGVLLLMGVGTLLPFNVFITEREYFDVRVQVKPTWKPLADSFESAIVLAFQIWNLAALLVLLPLQKRIPLTVQVLHPLLLNLVVLAAAMYVAANPALSGKAVIGTTLPGVGLSGVATALLQSGVYAIASKFSPLYIQATMAGQAVAGVGVAALSFATIAASPPSTAQPTREQVSVPATHYFLLAVLTTALCVAAYLYMWRSSFVQYHFRGPIGKAAPGSSPAPSPDNSSDEELALLPQPEASATGEMAPAPWTLQQMLRRLQGYIIVAAVTFAVTLAAFPGVSSAICSQHNAAVTAPCKAQTNAGRFYGDLFVPFSFIIFNVGDLLGRALAAIGPWSRRPPATAALAAYAVARVALLLGLLVCNVVTPKRWALPVFLRSDAFPVMLNLLLGVTNGHLAGTVLMHAPSLLPPHARGGCGSIMSFSIAIGILTGSLVSFALTVLLQQDVA